MAKFIIKQMTPVSAGTDVAEPGRRRLGADSAGADGSMTYAPLDSFDAVIHDWPISNEYTFHYRTYHHELSSTLEPTNTTVTLSDPFNNSYTLNTSGFITINNVLTLDFSNADDWREIHHRDSVQRRRMWWWGRYYRYHCSGWARAMSNCREWHEHPARIPPDGNRYWRRRKIRSGKFIAWYPGRRHKQGFNYHRSKAYCEVWLNNIGCPI